VVLSDRQVSVRDKTCREHDTVDINVLPPGAVEMK